MSGSRSLWAVRTMAVLALVGLAACGDDDGGDDERPSIAGTYDCAIEEAGPTAPVDVRVLQADGTVELRAAVGQTIKGTWSVKGDSVVMTIKGDDETFTIKGSRLVMITGGGDHYACDHVKGG